MAELTSLARTEKENELVELMQQMSDQAAKIAQRCDARETKAEVTGFMKTYLEDAEALDKLNETAEERNIASLVKLAVPLLQAHVEAVREHSLRLAADEDLIEAA